MLNTFTGTRPIIYHAPGAARRMSTFVELSQAARTDHEPVDCPDYHVITWDTKSTPSTLQRQLEGMQAPHTVLRADQATWTNHQKAELAVPFLEALEATYVIGLDAHDVVLTAHPSLAVRIYTELFSSPLLFNASDAPWPHLAALPDQRDIEFTELASPGLYRHLNAGTWIGETAYARDFFADVRFRQQAYTYRQKAYARSEQVHVRALAAKDHNVAIDTSCRIFQHIGRRTYLEEE